jgi:hypothetical protein
MKRLSEIVGRCWFIAQGLGIWLLHERGQQFIYP